MLEAPGGLFFTQTRSFSW